MTAAMTPPERTVMTPGLMAVGPETSLNDTVGRALQARIRGELAGQGGLYAKTSIVVHDGVAALTGALPAATLLGCPARTCRAWPA